ncbi:transglycosylase SLT domain-containing protein [Vibrio sp. DNB22_10_4]
MSIEHKTHSMFIVLLLSCLVSPFAASDNKHIGLKAPLSSINTHSSIKRNQSAKSGVIELRGGKSTKPFQPQISPLPAFQKSKPYQHLISEAALKWNVEQSLIYAVMHVESYFNPTAVSSAQALGLMQVTENGAVLEFSKRYLGGKALGREEVFVPRTNIDIGTAYLYLLDATYLNQIRSPKTRQLATIAAYNCGLTNLMKYTFDTKSLDYFVYRVNQTTTEEWRDMLTQRFPIAETRAYVAKVLEKKAHYLQLVH